MAGAGQHPWGPETLLCSCRSNLCPAEALLSLPWAMTAPCTLSLWHLPHFMLMHFRDDVVPVYLFTRLYAPQFQDYMFCLHYKPLFSIGLCKVALGPDSGCRLRNVLWRSKRRTELTHGHFFFFLFGFQSLALFFTDIVGAIWT